MSEEHRTPDNRDGSGDQQEPGSADSQLNWSAFDPEPEEATRAAPDPEPEPRRSFFESESREEATWAVPDPEPDDRQEATWAVPDPEPDDKQEATWAVPDPEPEVVSTGAAPEQKQEATWAVPDDDEPEAAAAAEAEASAEEPGEAENARFIEILQKLAERGDLNRAEADYALSQIVEGTVSEAQSAAFLMGLRVKGESADEIAGFLETMRRMSVRVESDKPGDLVDIVGTGSDQLGTFNISTAAAFVVAGAGVKVAKHGNRAASSKSGSADVLEQLGVRIDLTAEEVKTCLDQVGMGFMFAAQHHPAMGKVAGLRKALGVRTVFNLLGPLSNPAGVERYLLGVSSAGHLDVLAGALARVGCKHAMVVHGDDGMDELTVVCPSTVVEVERGVVQPPYSLSPEECGVQRWAPAGVSGGDAAANAKIIREVFKGAKNAARDAVILNAGAALYVAGAVSSVRDGVTRAAEVVDGGGAAKVVEELAALTQRLAEARA